MTVEIPLTRGQVAIVDDEDSDLAMLKWCTAKNGYGRRNAGAGKWEYMHRVILSRSLGRTLAANEFVDHINLHRVDNRRSNLRIATKAQNAQNSKGNARNKSGYRGVCWIGEKRKWRAEIKANGTRTYLGLFDTVEAAAEAYKAAAIQHHGEFARYDDPATTQS